MRFIKKKDCYLDIETGLEWSLWNYGPMTWHNALEFCVNLEGTWGLPSIQELLTLVDYEKITLTTCLPDMKATYYWSSTTDAYSTNYAWFVNFNHGYGHRYDDKNHNYYVRAVRGGRD